MTEANSMAFVVAHTTIPIPKLLGTYIHNNVVYIFMRRLPGIPLMKLLKNMSLTEMNVITSELKTMMDLTGVASQGFRNR